jgi:acyl-CoA synthetase (NDP forming)
LAKSIKKLQNNDGNNFNLKNIFKPKSMVVVGVSQKNYLNPGTIIFLKNLFEMKLGEHTYAVNPKGGILESQKIYENISNIPETPDVAVLAIPAKYTLKSVKECIDKGIKGIIAIGGGFAETGKEGASIQNDIAKLCIDANIPLIGPNCVGVYSPPYIDTIFLSTERLTLPKKGNVSIISQSGGVLLEQFFLSFREREIGVSSAISTGNKAVVNEVHLLNYFAQDNETDCIAYYIEGFDRDEGRKFLESSTKTQKDIVIYQGGKSEASKAAIQSHTASLGSNYQIATAAFKQYGIIQPKTEEEVLNYIKTYSEIALSKRKFNFEKTLIGKVAILTVSGGHGVVCVDLLDKYDLGLVEFNKKDIDQMKKLVNSTVASIGSFKNPIDLTGSSGDDDIVKILEFLMSYKEIDVVITIVIPYPPSITVQIGRRIALISRHTNKPLVCFVPYTEKYDLIRDSLELYHIPVANTVSETVQMAAAIRDKSRSILRLKANKLTSDDLNQYDDYYDFSS